MKWIANWKVAFLVTGSALIAACNCLTACYRTFSGVEFYDDEGTLMICTLRLLKGDVLYDGIATSYGPFYYLYQWCAHVLTGTPLSHASVRLITTGFWIGTTIVMCWLVWRATASFILVLVAELLCFHALRFVGRAPAHPQEACIFLLSCVGLSLFAAPGTLRMLLLGALTAALLVTKVNLGIFAIAAIAAGFVFTARPGWFRKTVVPGISCSALALPFLLMRGHLGEGWAMRYCLLVSISIAAVLLTAAHEKPGRTIPARDLAIGIVAFLTAGLAICWFPLSRGSSVSAMFHWLVVWPRTAFLANWYIPAPVNRIAVPLALSGLAGSVYLARKRQRSDRVAVAKLMVAAVVLLFAAGGLHGAILNVATPFVWLVAIPPANGRISNRFDGSARVTLAFLSVLQALYAFPVAGDQLAFTNVLMVAVAIILLSDGLDWIRSAHPELYRADWMRAIAPALATSLVLLAIAYSLHTTYRYYRMEPLLLPGTQHVRVTPEKRVALQDAIQHIDPQCTTLVTEPGMFSLNFWSGKPALQGLTIGAWMLLVDDAQQKRLVDLLARDSHACVVEEEEVTRFWTNGADASDRPLVRYIHENFVVNHEAYGYKLLTRQPLPAGSIRSVR